MGFTTRSSRFAVREILLVVIAAAASFLFINHENLYLTHGFQLADARIESYLLATVVLYLFLRVAIIAFEMRPPRRPSELVRCPECGQWIDDRTAAGLAAHHRIELTPKPSAKEVVSALALRKAVDAARIGNLPPPLEIGPHAGNPAVPLPSDLTGQDLIEALNDPDFLERARHSPRAPVDPRVKR
jgi:hypothetical protein